MIPPHFKVHTFPRGQGNPEKLKKYLVKSKDEIKTGKRSVHFGRLPATIHHFSNEDINPILSILYPALSFRVFHGWSLLL